METFTPSLGSACAFFRNLTNAAVAFAIAFNQVFDGVIIFPFLSLVENIKERRCQYHQFVVDDQGRFIIGVMIMRNDDASSFFIIFWSTFTSVNAETVHF